MKCKANQLQPGARWCLSRLEGSCFCSWQPTGGLRVLLAGRMNQAISLGWSYISRPYSNTNHHHRLAQQSPSQARSTACLARALERHACTGGTGPVPSKALSITLDFHALSASVQLRGRSCACVRCTVTRARVSQFCSFSILLITHLLAALPPDVIRRRRMRCFLTGAMPGPTLHASHALSATHIFVATTTFGQPHACPAPGQQVNPIACSALRMCAACT
jgi:hypothetical protein